MKKLITIALLTFFFASFAYADRWCQWSGTEGENCKNDRGGVVYLPFPTRTEALINAAGYYRVTITQPTIEEDQTRDAEVWGFADNQISLTWSIRDLTAIELDNRAASPMSVNDYYVWKAFIQAGIFTQAQLVAYFQANQPDMIEAYQARDRLLNP